MRILFGRPNNWLTKYSKISLVSKKTLILSKVMIVITSERSSESAGSLRISIIRVCEYERMGI